jgi:hypothetical protein
MGAKKPAAMIPPNLRAPSALALSPFRGAMPTPHLLHGEGGSYDTVATVGGPVRMAFLFSSRAATG